MLLTEYNEAETMEMFKEEGALKAGKKAALRAALRCIWKLWPRSPGTV